MADSPLLPSTGAPGRDEPEPLDPEDVVAQWQGRIRAAEDIRQPRLDQWRRNLDVLRNDVFHTVPEVDSVVVPKDHANTELKKSQLLFRSPEILLDPLQPGLDDAVQIFQAVLNRKLGPDESDVLPVLSECLFDLLCPAGLMAVKIGYEAVTEDRPVTEPAIDPMTGQPQLDPMTGQPAPPRPVIDPATGQPQIAPWPIFERYFWERISPAKLLIPPEFDSLKFDSAPWLGFEFVASTADVARRYDVPIEELQLLGTDEHRISEATPTATRPTTTKQTRGYEIWYRTSQFDPGTSKHPEHLTLLVLLDGQKTPAVLKPSPFQTIQADGAIAGMRDFPVHPYKARYHSDAVYVPSDCEITRPLVEELNKGRSQIVRQRATNTPLRWANIDIVDPKTIDKINHGDWQGIIPMQGTADAAIGEIARANFPRESFEFDQVISRDIDTAWSMSDNQRGLTTDTERTATEASIVQQATEVRMEQERSRIVAWYVAGVRKFAALIQMFADQPDFTQVVGADGAKRLATWNRETIAGTYLFRALPDSAVHLDAARERKEARDLYSFLANDPSVNRRSLIEPLLRKHHLDPTRVLVQQPPQPHPEPMKVSFAIKGEDLNPFSAQFPIVVELLGQAGVTIPPEAIQAGQQLALMMAQAALAQPVTPPQPPQPPGPPGGPQPPGRGPGAPPVPPGGLPMGMPPQLPHGGAVAPVENLSKHMTDQTGGRQGLPGGGIQ